MTEQSVENRGNKTAMFKQIIADNPGVSVPKLIEKMKELHGIIITNSYGYAIFNKVTGNGRKYSKKVKPESVISPANESTENNDDINLAVEIEILKRENDKLKAIVAMLMQ